MLRLIIRQPSINPNVGLPLHCELDRFMTFMTSFVHRRYIASSTDAVIGLFSRFALYKELADALARRGR